MQYLEAGDNYEVDNEQGDSDFEDQNPYIRSILKQLVEEDRLLRREQSINKPSTDHDLRLAYTAKLESGNDPYKINKEHSNRWTSGKYHIEQPTYLENLRAMGKDEAYDEVKKLDQPGYIKYIHNHPVEEEQVASKIIDRSVQKWGNKPVLDTNGAVVPAWRAAYRFGDRGLERYLHKTGQE